MTFSAQTSANQTQDILDGKMDKRRKGYFGPPVGQRYAIFVDDMNMPKREVYFAQPPIEILRQWMDHGGWYNRQLHQFANIVDVMFIGAMAPPGGGRQPVTNRFLRHFNHLAFPEMSEASLKMVFGAIFSAHLGQQGNISVTVANYADLRAPRESDAVARPCHARRCTDQHSAQRHGQHEGTQPP